MLKQDHFAYDEYTALETVLMGNQKLYKIKKEKDSYYSKETFSEEDGIRVSELESEFAELNGWEAESEAEVLLAGLGLSTTISSKFMKDLESDQKVKVLLAQALFGNPDILLLDEPTNHLDIYSINWLEEFLYNFKNTAIVVSHDRHFLNKVCTHIADIDFGKITTYTGNYDFWLMASELNQRLKSDINKKNEEKAKELKEFIQRFSANASKSRQATSRQKQLEKIEFSDMPISNRKYPFVGFESQREAGNDILTVDNIKKIHNGEVLLDGISFTVNKGDKIVLLGKNDLAKTILFQILMSEVPTDGGNFKWGITTSQSYFPTDNSKYFNNLEIKTLVDWLRQYSAEKDESFIRGFLGKMLFSKEEALKDPKVLSGGEKVRCMLSKTMLSGANVVILDGPTNHLDLESITAVNNGMKRFNGTLLFTSHDHELVQTVANRVIEIENGKISCDKYTTYDEYLNVNKFQNSNQQFKSHSLN